MVCSASVFSSWSCLAASECVIYAPHMWGEKLALACDGLTCCWLRAGVKVMLHNMCSACRHFPVSIHIALRPRFVTQTSHGFATHCCSHYGVRSPYQVIGFSLWRSAVCTFDRRVFACVCCQRIWQMQCESVLGALYLPGVCRPSKPGKHWTAAVQVMLVELPVP